MDVSELLIELYGRIPPLARDAVSGLDQAGLTEVIRPGSNSIGWLLWHLTRVQDHHLTELIGGEQLWVSGEWAAKFGLDRDPGNSGYGHSADEVAAVRPESPAALLDYLDATHRRTLAFLAEVTPADLDQIVDHRWDPPVTMGVRLVSVADDCLQHVGQASYLRGLLHGTSIRGS